MRLARKLLTLDPPPVPGEVWRRADGRRCTVVAVEDLGAGEPVVVRVDWHDPDLSKGSHRHDLVQLHRFFSGCGVSRTSRLYRTEIISDQEGEA